MSDARLWVIHAIACGEISCRHIIFCGRFIGAGHFQSFTSGLQEQMTGGQPHRRCSLNYIVILYVSEHFLGYMTSISGVRTEVLHEVGVLYEICNLENIADSSNDET